MTTANPFNIKVESLTVANFSQADVTQLYGQQTTATGQIFTPETIQLTFQLTQGQP